MSAKFPRGGGAGPFLARSLHLLADDSRVISYLFFLKLEKMSQLLSSAAVVIGAIRVKIQLETTELDSHVLH